MADGYDLLARLNGILPPEAIRVLREFMDSATGHNHDGTDSLAVAGSSHTHTLVQGASDVGSTEAEVDQVCDGVGATATAANLTSLTDGSNADSLHDHAYPNDVAFFDPGTATSGALLTRYTCPNRTVSFAANFGGSKAKASVAATAEAIYSIQKNGVEVGTITFAAAATQGTFTSTGGAAVSLTGTTPDVLTVVAPAYPDATLADVSITLKGSI